MNEKNIKIQFEKKTNQEWLKIKTEFNANYVIVPLSWDLKLNKILSNNEFKVYEI